MKYVLLAIACLTMSACTRLGPRDHVICTTSIGMLNAVNGINPDGTKVDITMRGDFVTVEVQGFRYVIPRSSCIIATELESNQ